MSLLTSRHGQIDEQNAERVDIRNSDWRSIMAEKLNTKVVADEKVAEPKRTPRINLNVPFWRGKDGKNRAAKYAKACGAYYDWRTKTWYTYAGHHGAKALARFMSDVDRKAYGFEA